MVEFGRDGTAGKRAAERERGILDGCVAVLREIGLGGVSMERGVRLPGGRHLDAVLYIEEQGVRTRFDVECKATVSAATVFSVQSRLAELGQGGEPMLCAAYVPSSLAQLLRGQGVHFVDVAGNVGIRVPGLYVDVRGRRPERSREGPSRLDQVSALRLIWTLLTDAAALNEPYRFLAEEAGVALGSVGWVMRDLRLAGHVRLAGRKRRELAGAMKLVDRWARGYQDRLWSKLFLERCRVVGGGDIDTVCDAICGEPEGDVLVGGEMGAARLLGWLRPKTMTLHCHGDPAALKKRYKLVPDGDGDVELLAGIGRPKAYGPGRDACRALAHPLALYAELARRESERLADAAREIHDKWLLKELG